jgi:hypothetical protein
MHRLGATWAFNPGRQLGGSPAVLRFDFERGEVGWHSVDGVELRTLAP